MKGDDIAERMLDFAVAMLGVTARLPTRGPGRHISSHLVRSSTAVGAHYEEARGAESRADFVHKIRLSAKESRESHYWLRLIKRARLIDGDFDCHIREADELAAILAASAKTARKESERVIAVPCLLFSVHQFYCRMFR